MEERKRITVNGEEISYFLSEKAVHIDNNEALKKAIVKPQAAVEMAEYILKEHQESGYGPLPIEKASLAIEIYGHVFPEKLAEAIKKVPLPHPFEEGLDKIIKKTDVIDAGHESIDGNRKIWDAIAVVMPI